MKPSYSLYKFLLVKCDFRPANLFNLIQLNVKTCVVTSGMFNQNTEAFVFIVMVRVDGIFKLLTPPTLQVRHELATSLLIWSVQITSVDILI